MKPINGSFEDFNRDIENKKLVVFGASVFLQVIASNYEELHLKERIEYIVDNAPDKIGTYYDVDGNMKPIRSMDHLLQDDLDNIVLLISPQGYVREIYRQLSEISELDRVTCYCLPVMMATNNDTPESGMISKDEYRIPKIIHCFWFSGTPKDDMAKRCLESWRKYCPDYEIKEWTADNYDLTKNRFMYDAYKARKWAYAADYARLDTVYEYGGFYFDLDLELTNGIDDLRYADFVAGFGPIRDVELAAFGAKKNCPLVWDMLKMYEHKNFDPGNLPLTEVQPVIMDRFMKEKGFLINGAFQNNNNMILLHRNEFSPRDSFTGEIMNVKHSYGIHHCAGSWINRSKSDADRHSEMKEMISIFSCGD